MKTKKYLKIELTYIVEIEDINLQEILEKMRELGAAKVEDCETLELTEDEFNEWTRS